MIFKFFVSYVCGDLNLMVLSALNGLLSSINPARHKTEGLSLEPYFSHLIIHKEIHGDKVFVPIDLKRIWNRL